MENKIIQMYGKKEIKKQKHNIHMNKKSNLPIVEGTYSPTLLL